MAIHFFSLVEIPIKHSSLYNKVAITNADPIIKKEKVFDNQISNKTWNINRGKSVIRKYKFEQRSLWTRKRLVKQVVTHYTSPEAWPSPYACAQPYHPGRYQATMHSCLWTRHFEGEECQVNQWECGFLGLSQISFTSFTGECGWERIANNEPSESRLG